MNIKQIADFKLSPSGKMSRSAFWVQSLLLIGLTLLVLLIWALLLTNQFMDVNFLASKADQITPGDIFGGWPTWVLGIYGVWLLVTVFCMQVRRMHDVGKSALLPALWWVLYIGGILCALTAESESAMITLGGLMIIISFIIGLIVLIYTLLGSKVVEGEEAAPSASAASLGLALVPWVLSALLYFTSVSSWVELAKAFDAQDEATALVHFNRAAESGNKVAKIMLLSQAVQKGDPDALPAVRELAESGNAFAQFLLSGMYAGGYPGLEQNTDESRKWLNKSAGQGFQPAIDQLKSLEE